MIFDTLDNAHAYRNLGPGFDLAFEFLRSGKAASVDLGRHELDGERVFVNVQEYTTRPAEEAVWEAHCKYADIQLIVTGRERIGYAPLATMSEDTAYDAEKDAAFYRGEGTQLIAPEGMFAIFLPQDVHMPGVADGAPSPVRKAVAKILLDR
ncbi:MAG: YhcH/YjgK/YiaL family protein [Phycisphaeraceae bacterium]